jgi:REP element-mobilizing transposase RayT
MIRRDLMAEFGWQRNYHERIVRNEKDLAAIRAYIRDNPCRWEEDAENPANIR